jgi:NTE family protein
MKVEATVVRRQSDLKSESGSLSENPLRPLTGLVLSSGGAKGLAHIGVIQVFEENGIRVDAVVGSSMGAYIAAVWAFGHDGLHMERLAREMEARWSLLRLIDPFLFPQGGLLRGERIRERLKASIGDARFSDLARPLRVVATNLVTLERAVFSAGEVALAVTASSAIPGMCAPVMIDDVLYFDGGVVDPLPVDVARNMGMDIVIAVNVVPTPAHLRSRLNAVRHTQSGNSPGALRRWLRLTRRGARPCSVLDVLHRTMLGAQMRLAGHSGQQADVVLRPLSIDGRWHDFHRAANYIALGRRAAEEHLPEIKRLLQTKPAHEHGAPKHPLAAAA